jgi:benzoyl-CoA reductase subunit A
MVVAGVDVGAETVKVVLMNDNQVLSSSIVKGGLERGQSAERAMHAALKAAGLSWQEVQCTVATGIGRKEVAFADEVVTEIAADARGVAFICPSARTIIDVGAEGARGIRTAAGGKVTDFAKNEKCAAGVGAFVGSMARALEVPLEDMGPLSLTSDRDLPMNATCVVFAESEVISLIHAKTPKSDIARAIHKAIATRTTAMVRRVGIEKDVVFIGGVARNSGVVAILKHQLGMDVLIPKEPQLLGAIGAAIIAASGNSMVPGAGGERRTSQKEGPETVSQRVRIRTHKEACPPEINHAAVGEQKPEFWRWHEYTWKAEDRDWRGHEMITAGVDIGSVSSKAAVMVDGEVYSYSLYRTGSSSPDSAHMALKGCLEGTGMTLDDIHFVVGTGYGRVNVPFARKTVTEIACHARGANFMNPAVRTILDMGGQDCKAILCDERGKVVQFLMNDKCAAGTGRGMEVVSDLLSVPIIEIGARSLAVDREPPLVSSTCVVFAKTEAVGLLREGFTVDEVLAAYCAAMAHRVVTLLQRLGVQQAFTITGGISKNSGVVKRIEKELGVRAVPVAPDPQLAGAIGAALFAKDLLTKHKARVRG